MKKYLKKLAQKHLFYKNYNSDYGYLYSLKRQNISFDNLIDIGAYDGKFTSDFTEIFNNSASYLFEAQTSKYKRLIRLFPDAKIFNVVLSDEVKNVEFYNYESGSSYKKEIGMPSMILPEKRQTDVLNNYINISDLINRKNYLKIDTQGSELEILSPCDEILKHIDFVQCEISVDEYNQNSPSQDKYINFFYARGFVIADFVYAYRDNLGKSIQFDLVFKKI